MRTPFAAALAFLVATTSSAAAAQSQSVLRQADECRSRCWRTHFHHSAEPAHDPDCSDPREADRWGAWCRDYEAVGRCTASCDGPVREAVERERRAAAERYQREQAEMQRRLEEARREHQQAIDRIARAERQRQLEREGRGAPRAGEGTRCDPWRDVEACEQACANGDGKACVAAAITYLGHPDGAPARDASRANGLLRRGCDAGAARGCWAMMFVVESHDDARTYHARAVGLGELGCQRDDADDCFVLGQLQYSSYQYGQTVPYPQVERSYRRGCQLGSIESCYMLIYYPAINGFIRNQHGMPGDASTLVERMLELAEQRCRGDTSTMMEDCMPLAALLAGYFSRPGFGTDFTSLPRELRRPNSTRALQIWDESCRNGFEWACRSANHVRHLQQNGYRRDW